MRTLTIATLLLAMAATAFAQDPNGNRMNEPYGQAKVDAAGARPFALSGLPNPFVNRMNVRMQGTGTAEFTGGPNPFGNRMNVTRPTTAPKAVEPAPREPAPIP